MKVKGGRSVSSSIHWVEPKYSVETKLEMTGCLLGCPQGVACWLARGQKTRSSPRLQTQLCSEPILKRGTEFLGMYFLSGAHPHRARIKQAGETLAFVHRCGAHSTACVLGLWRILCTKAIFVGFGSSTRQF